MNSIERRVAKLEAARPVDDVSEAERVSIEQTVARLLAEPAGAEWWAESQRRRALPFEDLVVEMRAMEERQLTEHRDWSAGMRQILADLERGGIVGDLLDKLGLEIWGAERVNLWRPSDDRFFVDHALAGIAAWQDRTSAIRVAHNAPLEIRA